MARISTHLLRAAMRGRAVHHARLASLVVFTGILAGMQAQPALAQSPAMASAASASRVTPIGLWKTIDDQTKQPKALVRVEEHGGVLSGRIEKLFDVPQPNPVCEACTDERKGKPIIGMTIVSGVKKFDDHWGDGKILDPKSGKVYSVKITPAADGKTLEVRGFVGVPMLGRTQVWLREQ